MKLLSETDEFHRIQGLCYFATRTLDACQGRLDRAHIIPTQRLKHHGLPTQDERVWLFACRKHHHAWDHGFIHLTRAELPPEVESYAAEHGIEWSLSRDFGEREAAAIPGEGKPFAMVEPDEFAEAP